MQTLSSDPKSKTSWYNATSIGMHVGGMTIATHRRRRAATVVAKSLDPYSPELLLKLVGIVGIAALTVTTRAVWGIKARYTAAPEPQPAALPFRQGLARIWAELRAELYHLHLPVDSRLLNAGTDSAALGRTCLQRFPRPIDATFGGAEWCRDHWHAEDGDCRNRMRLGSLRFYVMAGCDGRMCRLGAGAACEHRGRTDGESCCEHLIPTCTDQHS